MPKTARRPNIVLILADDMGYGDFAVFNRGLTETPALDDLIPQSVCLTHQYTASPVCNPSRACLLTGRYPHRTGSIDTLEWRGLERLALRETTLPDILKDSGYATGLVGKWHLGAFDRRYHPCRRGFDEAVCFRGGMHDYYQWRLEYGEHEVRRADGRYLTDVWTEEACGFIDRHHAEPFFLHVTYNAPHRPLQAPEAEVQPFLGREGINRGVATLYGMIRRMDHGVGRILEALDRNDIADNTVVIFTSDNGPQFGGQGENCLTRFNCGFHGAKGSVYEGGIRVPLIARWPDGLPAGQAVDQVIHFADWLPTILSLVGIQRPEGLLPIDGIDVSAVLRGESTDVVTRRFWQWNRYTPLVTCNAAMRDGPWKLIRPTLRQAMAVPDIHWLETCMYDHDYMVDHGVIRDPEPPREVPDPPPPELYDIRADPLERTNLAEDHPEIVSRMLGELETWFEEVEADRAGIEDQW